MTHAANPDEEPASLDRLASGLAQLRDSLINASLALRDLHDELDVQRREKAAAEMKQMLERIGSR